MTEKKVIQLRPNTQEQMQVEPKQGTFYNYELDDLYPKINEFMRNQLLEAFTRLSERLIEFQYGEVSKEDYLNDVKMIMDIHMDSIKHAYTKSGKEWTI